MSGRKNRRRQAAFGFMSVALFFLAKVKYLLIILKFTKLSTLITLFLSLGVYAIAYGWAFAIALMYSLVLHESGHMLAAKQRKIETSAIFFIPFIGAAAGLKGEPKHSKDESFVAYGGPFLGAVATVFALGLYLVTRADVWLLAVYLGSIINLFNLIPISPLDGGRIVTVISPKIWLAGLLLLGAFMFIAPNPILLVILFIGVAQVIIQIREPYAGRLTEAYLRMLYRRKEDFGKLQENEDIYQRNLTIYKDERHRSNLMERIRRLKERKRSGKTFQKARLYLLKKQAEIYHETSLEGPDDSLKWLEETIKSEEKKYKRAKNYFKTSIREKIVVGMAYVCLTVFLGALYFVSQGMLPPPSNL